MSKLTVSHVRQRVSLVNTPSKSLCTSVASRGCVPEFELPVTTVGGVDPRVGTEFDTNVTGYKDM